MTLSDFLNKIDQTPNDISFSETMAIIEQCYSYTPTAFANGAIHNTAGSNEGSCKIFAFAKINALSQESTLALFGQYYRDDVMLHPNGSDHANIRNFIQHGWAGIEFEADALKTKA